MRARRLSGDGEVKSQKCLLRRGIFLCLLVLALGMSLYNGAAAQGRRRRQAATPGPMLAQGIVNFSTPNFDLSLVKSSQTVAALKPKGADGFDFTPGDLLVARSQDGFYHLGDIDLRLRVGDSGEWKDYSTAHERKPVIRRGVWTVSGAEMKFSGTQQTPANAAPTDHLLADADLTPSLGADIPIQVTREWRIDRGQLVMRFS